MVELAHERRRFGYRRLHVLSRRECVQANYKRVQRLYRLAKLAVRRRRERVAFEREPLALPGRPNEVRSMDFVMDRLEDSRRLKARTIVDDFTNESVNIALDHGMSSHYVVRILEDTVRFRCRPGAIRTDQGPEFTARALDQWAYRNGVTLKLIQPGKPTQNAYIKSFNGKFRDECLNEHWFSTLAERGLSLRPGGATTTSSDRTAHLATRLRLSLRRCIAPIRATQRNPSSSFNLATMGSTKHRVALWKGSGHPESATAAVRSSQATHAAVDNSAPFSTRQQSTL